MSQLDAAYNPVDILNEVRSMELQAISQYMGHHYVLEDIDMPELAKAVKKISIDEMRHAEMLGIRILELGGTPVRLPNGMISNDEAPETLFATDYGLETNTVNAYAEYIQQLERAGDQVSAQLIKKIIVQEEGHRQYFLDIYNSIMNYQGDFLSKQISGKFKAPEYVKFVVGEKP